MKLLKATLILLVGIISFNLLAANNQEDKKITIEEANAKLNDKSFVDQASYAIGAKRGVDLAQVLAADRLFISYDQNKVLEGMSDVLNNKLKLSPKEIEDTFREVVMLAEAKKPEVLATLAKEEEAVGAKYREEFAKQKNVKKTDSGILYIIRDEGTGKSVQSEREIKAELLGLSVKNNQVFVSTEKDKPVVLNLGEMPKGFVEAVKLIKQGGVIDFVLPPELAYGDKGLGNVVAPKATLAFKVKLVDINTNSATDRKVNKKRK